MARLQFTNGDPSINYLHHNTAADTFTRVHQSMVMVVASESAAISANPLETTARGRVVLI
jgi:hypothetical protein